MPQRDGGTTLSLRGLYYDGWTCATILHEQLQDKKSPPRLSGKLANHVRWLTNMDAMIVSEKDG